jgi:predicted lipoprotein with Yx(FWY)xxD motif
MSEYTTKNGLLYRDGELVGLPEADQVASEHGYMFAERMVHALEKDPKTVFNPESVMTIEKFSKIEAHSPMCHGESIDNYTGINLSNSDQKLKWVAIKGGAEDWAIYAGFTYHTYEDIARGGDKVVMEKNIRKLVPCDDEVYSRYRF